MTDLMFSLQAANSQLEMARIYYKKMEDDPMFDTDDGKHFKHWLAEAIRCTALAQLNGCLLVIEQNEKETVTT